MRRHRSVYGIVLREEHTTRRRIGAGPIAVPSRAGILTTREKRGQRVVEARLLDRFVEPRGGGREVGRGGRPGPEEDDRKLRPGRSFSKLSRQCVSAHLRQVLVYQGHLVGTVRVQLLERLVSRCEDGRLHAPRLRLLPEECTVGVVGGDNENLHALHGGRRSGSNSVFVGLRAVFRFFRLNREVERGSLADRTLDPHFSPHRFCELLGNGEAEPGAPVLPALRRIDLTERLEEPVALLFRDADAGIPHAEVELIRAVRRSGRRRHPDPERNLPLFGELDRVGQQVEKNLMEAGSIPANHGRDRRVDQVGQLDALLCHLGGEWIQRLLDAGLYADGRLLQLRLAGL